RGQLAVPPRVMKLGFHCVLGWWKPSFIRCDVPKPGIMHRSNRCRESDVPMAMEMDHSFTVPVPPDQAWDVLLDVKRIAPCMPGATVDEVDGDVVNGRIKVKVGPVSLTYKGTAKFTERDPDAHVVVLEASGKETRGAGTASATVRASMVPDASGSGTD